MWLTVFLDQLSLTFYVWFYLYNAGSLYRIFIPSSYSFSVVHYRLSIACWLMYFDCLLVSYFSFVSVFGLPSPHFLTYFDLLLLPAFLLLVILVLHRQPLFSSLTPSFVASWLTSLRTYKPHKIVRELLGTTIVTLLDPRNNSGNEELVLY